MDDYSSLAHRIAGGVADVRGCLILSRDGLILGSFPEDESVVKPSWLRFAALGEPERSFVEFGGEVWAYLRRGPYAAFAIAGLGVRPGLLIDQLEQVLMAAEEARNRRDSLKVPESPASLSGKPRTSLHPPAGAPLEGALTGSDPRPWNRGTKADEARDEAAPAPEPVPPAGERAAVPAGSSSGPSASAPRSDAAAAVRNGPKADAKQGVNPTAAPRQSDGKGSGPKQEPGREGAPSGEHKKRKKDEERAAEPASTQGGPTPSPDGGKPTDGGREGLTLDLEPDAEVDRVLLAKEFSGLLQVEAADDEAQS
jgi:hypothetical protein